MLRVGHDWETEVNWTHIHSISKSYCHYGQTLSTSYLSPLPPLNSMPPLQLPLKCLLFLHTLPHLENPDKAARPLFKMVSQIIYDLLKTLLWHPPALGIKSKPFTITSQAQRDLLLLCFAAQVPFQEEELILTPAGSAATWQPWPNSTDWQRAAHVYWLFNMETWRLSPWPITEGPSQFRAPCKVGWGLPVIAPQLHFSIHFVLLLPLLLISDPKSQRTQLTIARV